jgi:hypothetical protein
MIVNEVAMDYLTVTTFTNKEYERAFNAIDDNCDRDWERSGVMQYKGNASGGLFHGQGEQQGRTHYMVRASGEQADKYGYAMLQSGARVTRLDIQITLEMPNWWDVRAVTDSLRGGVWPNRIRKITSIDGNGEDTVYIGSRTSDKFIRVYVKGSEWLRFEIELKGDAARVAAKHIKTGGRPSMAGILLSELSKLPMCQMVDYFMKGVGKSQGSVEIKVRQVQPEKIKKMRWLASLLPAIEQLMNDHDYGHSVYQWFGEMRERSVWEND